MSKPMTGATIPKEVFDILKAMGLPEHVTKFHIWCHGPLEPILIEATFITELPKWPKKSVPAIKRYKLVEEA